MQSNKDKTNMTKRRKDKEIQEMSER